MTAVSILVILAQIPRTSKRVLLGDKYAESYLNILKEYMLKAGDRTCGWI